MVSHNGGGGGEEKKKLLHNHKFVLFRPISEGDIPVSSQLWANAGAFLALQTARLPSAWTTAERFFFIQSDVGETRLHVPWEYFTSSSAHD